MRVTSTSWSSWVVPDVDCPCGSGEGYDACCGPVVRNERAADTAEELMRSRYTAYVLGDVDHVFRSWHPSTRPDRLDDLPQVEWLGLEVLETVEGGPDDDHGVVEFRARHNAGVLHERSRFGRRAGRWVYRDGDVLDGGP
jgi:SEC-C motif-containing protein